MYPKIPPALTKFLIVPETKKQEESTIDCQIIAYKLCVSTINPAASALIIQFNITIPFYLANSKRYCICAAVAPKNLIPFNDQRRVGFGCSWIQATATPGSTGPARRLRLALPGLATLDVQGLAAPPKIDTPEGPLDLFLPARRLNIEVVNLIKKGCEQKYEQIYSQMRQQVKIIKSNLVSKSTQTQLFTINCPLTALIKLIMPAELGFMCMFSSKLVIFVIVAVCCRKLRTTPALMVTCVPTLETIANQLIWTDELGDNIAPDPKLMSLSCTLMFKNALWLLKRVKLEEID
ncbi:Hypothetical_protein [Hexamita inflata]|uniref:Hypothetical_protein n=1 Tax=Hexamita inflata TaxID=28002 RepID=A0AA86PF20_9EUKA|nr:Hypothetical protein HINF_LOCUS24596 [Hexamita inflata]